MSKIKEEMEKLHPKPESKTPIGLLAQVVRRQGKSGKELVTEGLEAWHPTQGKAEQESASVRLAKLKLKEGIPLSPQDKMALGFEHLHGKLEEANEQ